MMAAAAAAAALLRLPVPVLCVFGVVTFKALVSLKPLTGRGHWTTGNQPERAPKGRLPGLGSPTGSGCHCGWHWQNFGILEF
jgi:hypothetical protein